MLSLFRVILFARPGLLMGCLFDFLASSMCPSSVLRRASELLSLGVLLLRLFSLLLGAVLHADWVLFRECLMMVFKKSKHR